MQHISTASAGFMILLCQHPCPWAKLGDFQFSHLSVSGEHCAKESYPRLLEFS